MVDRFLKVFAVTGAALLLTAFPLAADEYVNSKSPDKVTWNGDKLVAEK